MSETFGFTCMEQDCAHNDTETPEVEFATMGEALDEARAHRAEHAVAVQGIVTSEMPQRAPALAGRTQPQMTLDGSGASQTAL